MDSKTDIRRSMREARRNVSESDRESYSAAVCRRILRRTDVAAAIASKASFAVYMATRQEIDLTVLVEHLWNLGCTVLAPAWNGKTYVLARWSHGTALISGPMGVLEPVVSGGEEVASPKVWIVPGLAFTRSGGRLGYGGGWYDRLLASAAPSAISLGVAYPFQVVENLPSEEHDVALTDVVTA